MKKYKEVSIDPTTQKMYERAQELGIETVWERLEKQQPQCGYGLLGICCRNCLMGPCRINPFGGEPKRGVCGADADTIVARNLLRMIAAGAAAHSDHGRHVALTLLVAAEMAEKFKKEGKPVLELDNMASNTLPYQVRDPEKLKAVAKRLGIETEGKSIRELAKEVAEVALNDFGKQDEEPLAFLKAYLNPKTYEIFEKAAEKAGMPWFESGILPRSIDREIVESLHRTHIGTDHDPVSILLHGLKTALGDAWGGSLIATELQDVLFGTPKVIKAEANLGVLKEDYVNIVVHGHEPVLSEKIVEAAQDPELIELAQKLGAKGINVVGMCCTGLEVLMRHGIPIAGNFLQQEMAIVTGAVEAMVVDVQCIMPATVDVARCFHTKIIDTSPIATFPGAIHIKFDERRADEIAKEIVKTAVENFPNRSKQRVEIPKEKMSGYVGFSVEAILEHFGGSLKPIEEAIVEGKIKGVAGLVGCNNPKVKQDHNHIKIANELMKRDVLLIGTGCWATAAMKYGIFLPEYADTENVGPGLREFAKEWGIPPALNMGSCVDCTRMLVLADLIARDLNVPISALPVVGSAPEAMTEKAVSIGTYFVASGITTHLGVVPPVLGGPKVVKILTQDLYDIVGAAFIVEPDPYKAAKLMYEHIMKKRKELGI
ncbi:anaerobic carbon-monoxide dehydrogenase catalytic subunit [Thermococcus sp. AM4]|uniref:anaerobic carbon-monoxide dehydrogenase catalytic subunit n=1 Tax=Thermococcus sp. (strain AM4) TaxID=246969 RepID=UPI0001870536|nr:anaerobic carbon-monoxide dehydrogenase catalytic subunit [Thermococcus sp. AM4]EEB74637.1 Carbon monoxide dehydrogenase CooS [Thermococcus sp. AM4]